MMQIPADWWRDFFSGVVVEMWLEAMPEEVTRQEVDCIQRLLEVRAPARLLDVPCGGGRLALPLAAAGFRMTGADISSDFLDAARACAAEKNLAVDWLQVPMSDIPWSSEFDGAFCSGNSFGYDDDDGNAAFLKAVFHSLKPQARFVLDCPSVLDLRLPTFQERNWWQFGEILFLEDEHYDPVRGRTDTEYTFIRDGIADKRLASHRNYTCREVHELLHNAGFVDVQSFGGLNDEPFRLGSERLVLVGTKP
jgi:SAM-dependent methyltransferase